MKQLFLFSVLSILCLTISAQTNTWNGGVGSWNNSSQWSLNMVPNANHDVIIPSGSEVTLTVDGFVKSINVQGNAVFNFDNTYHRTLSLTNPSTFSAESTLNWPYGYIAGGGTLTLNGTTNISDSSKWIKEGTTVINNGTMNNQGGVTYIQDGTLINASSGVIDMQTRGGNFQTSGSGSHVLINEGLIKHTSAGEAAITVELHNNDGTISVESGTLTLSGDIPKYLSGGVYNVASDAIFKWTKNINFSGTLVGTPQGQILCNSATLIIPQNTTAIFNFTGSTGIVWDRVDFTGSGTLVNLGKITLNGSTKYLKENTSIQNEGIMNFETSSDTYIKDGSLINKPSGVIDLKTVGGNIVTTGSGSHLFINEGLIKHTSSGEAVITAELHNNNGTISVESGTLTLSGTLPKYLTDGIHNVAAGARFHWDKEVVCAGTLTGVLDGDIYCNSNTTKIPASTTAILNFTGNTGVVWDLVHFTGSGTLINRGKINLNGSSKFIKENTTLQNEGIFNIENNGVTYIQDGTLINKPSGIIDMQAVGGNIQPSGSGSHLFINEGLIKRSTTSGTAAITVATTNSGIIDVQMGELDFAGNLGFNNTVDGKVMGIGFFNLPPAAAFTNDGIFSPGGAPGTLTVIGDFKSSPTSELQIEIYGLTQGTEYDLLAIQGNAIMDGGINLALNFAPNLNDEFVVVTANNISSCNLPATVSQTYEGYSYTFTVICNPDNVTLKVTDIVLGFEENILSNVHLYPNPSNGNFNIDLGKEYTDVSIAIYNMLGQLISLEKYATAKMISPELDASPGTYFVKVSIPTEGSKTFRVIKQ